MAKLINFDLVEADAILFEGTSLQSYGYGIISQLPMKDKNMSIQAKGVYAYLVACAGSDKQTYPSQSKICSDLNIGKPATLRKYVRELQENGYIKIVKTKKNNVYYKNVYLIATDTRSIEVWKNEFAEGKEIEEAEIVEENKKSLTYGEVKDTQKSKTEINNSNNSIHENIENMQSNLVENNIDDVEAKNKALMEQERKFVPSFSWN